MFKRKKRHSFILLLVTALLLTCATDPEKSAILHNRGGQVNIGLMGTVNELYPYNLKEYYAQEISAYLLNPAMVSLGKNGEPMPVLAAAWHEDARNNNLTYFIRKDIRWSNGDQLTAADVAASYDFLKRNESRLGEVFKLSDIAEISTVDSFTVRFHFVQENTDPFRVSSFPVMHRSQVDSAQSVEQAQNAFNELFIGCGPFVLSGMDNKKITLIRNPYYRKSKPYLESIVFRFYNSPDSILNALQNDIIQLAPSLPVQLGDKLAALKNYKLSEILENGFDFIGWNMERPQLSAAAVRRALTHAVDRKTLVDGILSGYGKIHETPANPDFWAYHYSEPLDYNPQQALNLFAQEGWQTDAEKNVLQKDGQPFVLNIIANAESRMRAELAVNIKAYYRVLGIDVKTEMLPWDQLLMRLEKRDFDGVIISWQENGPFNLSELFHSSNIATGNNFMGYNNPQADYYLDQASRFTSYEQRLENWQAFQKMVIDDQPVTVLFTKKDINVYSKNIGNVNFTGHGFLKNAENWYIRAE